MKRSEDVRHEHAHECAFQTTNTLSRRGLLQALCGAMGAAVAGGCAWRVPACKTVPPNPFVAGDRPLLIAVEGEDLAAMLHAGIEALGGLDRLLPFDRQVIFKANYIARQRYPVTTAPDLVAATAQQFKKSGFEKTTLFEAHGSALAPPSFGPASHMEGLGVVEHVQKSGVEVYAGDILDRDQFRLVRSPAWSIPSPVAVHKKLHEAGLVVSLPVLKRHAEARLTCALKMHFGSVLMADRLVAHKHGHTGRLGFFDHRLVHFADAVKPQLNIVDARAILTRSGPTLSAGGEVLRGVNRIVLCGDMVATDAYCARLMAERDSTFSVDMIAAQLKHAVELGLGTADLDRVKIVEIKA